MISGKTSHQIKDFFLHMNKCRNYDLTGSIYDGISLKNNEKALIQVIAKTKLRKTIINPIENIKKIQNLEDNNNIIKIIDFLDSRSNLYIFYENAQTNLKDYIQQHSLSESVAMNILKDVIKSFENLYKNDLIPIYFTSENFFISQNEIKQICSSLSYCENIKLWINEIDKERTFFLSPEIFEKIENNEYEKMPEFDQNEKETLSIWSLAYSNSENTAAYLKKLKKEIYFLDNTMKNAKISVSNEAKNFLKKMLEYNPKNRIKWREIFEEKAKKENVILNKEVMKTEITPKKDFVNVNNNKHNSSEIIKVANKQIHEDNKDWRKNLTEEFRNSQIHFEMDNESPIHIKKNEKENDFSKISRVSREVSEDKNWKKSLLDDFEKSTEIKKETEEKEEDPIIITRDTLNVVKNETKKASLFKQKFSNQLDNLNKRKISQSEEHLNIEKSVEPKIEVLTDFLSDNKNSNFSSEDYSEDFSPLKFDVKTYVKNSDPDFNYNMAVNHEYKLIQFIIDTKSKIEKCFSDINLNIYKFYLGKYALTKINILIEKIENDNITKKEIKENILKFKKQLFDEYFDLYEKIQNEKLNEFCMEMRKNIDKKISTNFDEYKTIYRKCLYNLFQKFRNKAEFLLKNGDTDKCFENFKICYLLLCCLDTDRFFPMTTKNNRCFSFERFYLKLQGKSISKINKDISLLLKKIL